MRTQRRFGGMVLAAATLVALLVQPGRAAAAPIWADVTTAGPTTFAGNVGGDAFTGTFVNFGPGFTNTAGTSNFFSGQPGTFTPLLPLSDGVGFFSEAGFTLTFASPVVNPIFDIFSLANTLDFGTPVTLVSAGPSNFGGVGITVSGNRVVGTSAGGLDANGTIQLTGTFSTLTVTPTGIIISDGVSFIFAAQPAATAVPEPSSLALLALGTAGLAGWRRWRKRTA